MNKKLKKILFVDDDPDAHLIVKISLQELSDIELYTALSGEEAIKIALNTHPDLILLDVMMPDLDGIVTLQAIKLLPSLAKTPVVFLTARVQKNEIAEYFKCGILDVITKPFNPITLPETINQIWEKYQKSTSTL